MQRGDLPTLTNPDLVAAADRLRDPKADVPILGEISVFEKTTILFLFILVLLSFAVIAVACSEEVQYLWAVLKNIPCICK